MRQDSTRAPTLTAIRMTAVTKSAFAMRAGVMLPPTKKGAAGRALAPGRDDDT